MYRPRMRAATIAVIACVAAFVLAGCSVSHDASSTEQAEVSGVATIAELAKRVPEPIASSGTLRVAMDPTYPPFGSIESDGKTIVGFDADMALAIGNVLGLEVTFVNTSFDAIIPALQADKVDLALSSIGDTKAREQVVDFATYYWGGGLFLVAEGNPHGIAPGKTCGKRIGVNRGSLQQTTFLPEQAAACDTAGEPAPIVEAYQGNQAQLALQANRIDAIMLDAPAGTEIAAKSDGSMEVVGPITRNPNPGGVALPKGSELTPVVSDAINSLIASGDYERYLAKWDLSAIAVDASTVNGATS